jgi:hypothetical protein
VFRLVAITTFTLELFGFEEFNVRPKGWRVHRIHPAIAAAPATMIPTPHMIAPVLPLNVFISAAKLL